MPTPPGMLTLFASRGSFWLLAAIITVSLWAVGMVMGMMTSFFEGDSPYAWKLALMLASVAMMILVVGLMITKALEARRLSHYCSDCAAILEAQKLPGPGELGSHKVRLKKG